MPECFECGNRRSFRMTVEGTQIWVHDEVTEEHKGVALDETEAKGGPVCEKCGSANVEYDVPFEEDDDE